MTRSALEVVAAIRSHQPDVPDVKLQKLLYYCQGHHLAATGEPLFDDEVVAWNMGPVVLSVWKAGKNNVEPDSMAQAALSEAQLNTVGYVMQRYGAMHGNDLARLSHHEDPWLEADRDRPAGGQRPIPVDSIRVFFEREAAEELRSDSLPTRAELEDLIAGAEERRDRPVELDSFTQINERLTALRR